LGKLCWLGKKVCIMWLWRGVGVVGNGSNDKGVLVRVVLLL
jgi:hypothetical protein